MTAGAVNIKLGLTVSDVLTGLQTAGSATSQYVTQFKKQFDGLKGSTEAPAGALNSLTRQLTIAKREIGDLVAVGGAIPNSLVNRFTLLQNAVTAAKSAVNTPVQGTPFAQLNQNLADTKSRMQDLLATGKPVPRELADEYKKLENQVNQVNSAFTKAAPPLGPFSALNQRLTDTRTRMQDILATGGRVPTALSAQYAQLNQRVAQVNSSFQQTPGLLGRLGISAGVVSTLTSGFFAASFALNALQAGLKITSDFQRMDTALRAVSSSTADFGRSQAFLQASADKYGISLQSLSQAYVGFKANTNDTILRGAEAERIFLSVAKASAALQLSTEDTTGTLRAFGQMLSKGTVQSEELKGQVGERLYGAFSLAARAMGVTTQQLNKMLQSGEVMAVDLLPKLATEIDKTFGSSAIKNVDTMAGGFTRATDQVKLFIAEFSKNKGIDSFFARIGNGLADLTKNLRNSQKGQLQNEVDTFSGFSEKGQDKRIKELTEKLAGKQAELEYLRSSGSLLSIGDKKREIGIKNEIAFMGQLYVAFKRVTDLRGGAGKVAVDAGFDIDKARAEQASLLKQIQNARGAPGGVVPASLQARYDKVTADIERATGSVNKHKAAHEAVGNQLTTNERLLNKYSLRLREAGSAAPDSLKNTVRILTDAVAKEKAALAEVTSGPVNIGTPALNKRNLTGVSPELVTFQALGFPSLDAITQAGTQIINRLRLTRQAIADSTKQTTTQFDISGPKLPYLDQFLDRMKQDKERFLEGKQQFVDAMAASKADFANAAANVFAGFGEAAGRGGNPLKAGLQIILNILGDYAIRIGTAALISSKALLLAAPFLAGATLPQGIGLQLTGAGLIVAGGIVKGLAATAFAQGGLVYGPTLGLVGEGIGTTRSNPEVIAPLDKLKGMISPASPRRIEVFGRIEASGNNMVVVIDRAQESNSRYF